MFAIKAVIQERPPNLFKTLGEYMSGSRVYAGLFKRRYAAGRAWLAPLSEGDQARLAELERMLPIEMIKKRRTATWRHLHDEDKCKDHRQRDLSEMEDQLQGTPLEQWG